VGGNSSGTVDHDGLGDLLSHDCWVTGGNLDGLNSRNVSFCQFQGSFLTSL
jgi:hypothetical protein